MAGEDRWFRLEPRSSASRVQGDCQLVLKLITTQVRAHPCQSISPLSRPSSTLPGSSLPLPFGPHPALYPPSGPFMPCIWSCHSHRPSSATSEVGQQGW